MDFTSTDLGQNIKKCREKYLSDTSENNAAMMAYITQRHLNAIEAGKGDTSISTILNIAEAWNIPVEEFFKKPKFSHRPDVE